MQIYCKKPVQTKAQKALKIVTGQDEGFKAPEEVPPKVELEEEPKFPTGPNGRMETQWQREKREAHNLYMKFNRSIQSH